MDEDGLPSRLDLWWQQRRRRSFVKGMRRIRDDRSGSIASRGPSEVGLGGEREVEEERARRQD
jgi:hypothetical protein